MMASSTSLLPSYFPSLTASLLCLAGCSRHSELGDNSERREKKGTAAAKKNGRCEILKSKRQLHLPGTPAAPRRKRERELKGFARGVKKNTFISFFPLLAYFLFPFLCECILCSFHIETFCEKRGETITAFLFLGLFFFFSPQSFSPFY